MPPILKIELKNPDVLKLLGRAVQQMDARQGNELMKRISGSLLAAVEDNFEDQGRPKWEPLSALTIEQRKKDGHWPGKILQRSGRLKNSITQHWSPSLAAVGTNLIYARIQQSGGVIRAKKAKALRFGGVMAQSVRIPAREFLKLTDQDMVDLSEDINDWYDEILRQNKLI
ncbi:MAG: phage virion morphogenesis protein [Comamonas sp.]|uniref:phage virion morphogenesis protein n=1 Tax=Comamonas sp. TaxID=34028 RepID=UPI002FCC8532